MSRNIKGKSMARYTISKKENVLIPEHADTTLSGYPVTSYRGFRKFVTREAARSYKRSLKIPSKYCIVDTVNANIIR